MISCSSSAPRPARSSTNGQGTHAEKEKAAVAALLKEQLGLELSETKTLVTPVTKAFAFLGHHVVVRHNRAFERTSVVTLIPKQRSHRARERIKRLCRRHRTGQSLHDLLRDLNWLLRGWSAFYRHAWGAKRVFCSLDYYAWWTVFRWLRKKHQRVPVKALKAMYPPSKERGMRRDSGTIVVSRCSSPAAPGSGPTGWPGPARLSSRSIMESRVHNERCMPGSEGGARKPTGESRQGAGRPPYATRISSPQASQRTRAKPCARMPQRR